MPVKFKSPCGDTQQQSYFERLNYYFGKLMTVRDFQAEQSYFNEKRWLLNRFGLGWGVLCGLQVKPCPGSSSKVRIAPGVAVDQYGHEIWVRQEHVVDLAEIARDDEMVPASPPDPPYCYVSLKYFECDAEPSPLPVEECGAFDTECVYNRRQERFKFKVSWQAPDLPDLLTPPVSDLRRCEIDCFRFLENPCAVIVDHCLAREQCLEIPLAQVLCREGQPLTPEDIDNCSFRKLAYSNEMLYQLLHCLKEELWKAHAAKYDRRRFVPLLAQTIKGVRHRDGRNQTMENVGLHPQRITTDGDYIWITDSEDSKILRINRDAELTSAYIPEYIDLQEKTWGIAFDGHYMWVSHHLATPQGKLTRINVCDATDKTPIMLQYGKPKELLFDGNSIWVSYETANYLSQIDAQTCQIIKDHELPFLQGHAMSPIKAMVFDGLDLWIVYDTKSGDGLRKLKISGNDVTSDEALDCDGNYPEDVIFEGTNIFVPHESGLTKIDLDSGTDIGRLPTRDDYTAIAFDGMYLWAAVPKQGKICRIDAFMASAAGEFEIRRGAKNYEISKICYDGTYLWVAASEESGTSRVGVIHRLLP